MGIVPRIFSSADVAVTAFVRWGEEIPPLIPNVQIQYISGKKGSQGSGLGLEKTGRGSKGIEALVVAMIGVDVPSKQKEKTTVKC